jgi:hypothetical protein
MYITVNDNHGPWHALRHNRWFGEWEDGSDGFHIVNKDSLWLNNVKVNIEQSPDSLFHVYQTRASRGANAHQASEFASHVAFPIGQIDSILTLPRGFMVSKKDKFRNQQVLVTVEVPLGKTVQVSKNVNEYSWYTVNTHGTGVYYSRHSGDDYRSYGADRVYTMTVSGLRKDAGTTSKGSWDDDDDDNDD